MSERAHEAERQRSAEALAQANAWLRPTRHGMLERAELMGGDLRFRSSIGHGSVLRLSL